MRLLSNLRATPYTLYPQRPYSMKKILIIEDNFDVRENIAEILELSNYDVIAAENGKIGIEKAIEHMPDLILCDVMMPELNGYGVLHILDRNPKTAEIPFIFLTAKAEKADFRKGMNLGADDYITKPFDDEDLLQAIDLRIKKSTHIKENTPKHPQAISEFVHELKNIKEADDIIKKYPHKSYTKKTIIYEENAYPKQVFYIKKGKVKTYKTNEVAKEYIIDILEAGDYFGHQALIASTEYAESAAAMEDVELILVPKKDFFALLYNDRIFAAQFIKILAANSVEQEEKLLSLAYNSIRKRVAEALIQLYQQYQNDKISILREDLANMVGTAKESVTRTLSDFKNEGLVDIKGSNIFILKADALMLLPN